MYAFSITQVQCQLGGRMKAIGLLVGREKELEFLMGQMASAISREGHLVLISGEAGSGKTALCETFIELAIKSDALILVGRCVPGSQSPYLPFVEAFSNQVPNPFAEDEASNTNPSVLFLSVLRSIERISEDRTLILWLEDLHWADSASIALIHFLARNVKTLKALVLGTYRQEDIHAGAAAGMNCAGAIADSHGHFT